MPKIEADRPCKSVLRDRGLLAYHMEDFGAALRDLETYLRLVPRGDTPPPEEEPPDGADEGGEHARIWEHVKALRRRVAGFN